MNERTYEVFVTTADKAQHGPYIVEAKEAYFACQKGKWIYEDDCRERGEQPLPVIGTGAQVAGDET